jgi:hypothetical protein
MFIKDGIIYSNVGQLKQLHPTVSFSKTTPYELGYEDYQVPPPPPYVPTATDIKIALSTAVENHLNAKANEYRYKDYHAAMAYLGSPIARFQREAEAFMNWVSFVWSHVDAVEDDVANGRRGIPTIEELIEELPDFTPPEQ